MALKTTRLPKSFHRHQGFTLVEILVVLAIIGVLAALLFPAFSSVRRNAHLTSCASNLHQIVLGLHMYRQDWNKLPPRARLSNRRASSWEPLMPYLNNTSIIQCPYGEFPNRMDQEYIYPTGPGNTVLNPESSTVVAYCGEHLEHDAQGAIPFMNGPEGRYFAGTWIVGRMDGSTARVDGSNAPRWIYANEQWSPEHHSAPDKSFVTFRFPGEAWPPQFE